MGSPPLDSTEQQEVDRQNKKFTPITDEDYKAAIPEDYESEIAEEVLQELQSDITKEGDRLDVTKAKLDSIKEEIKDIEAETPDPYSTKKEDQ